MSRSKDVQPLANLAPGTRGTIVRVTRDLTSRAERLAAMGQTIATLSHHVKNILQGISGGSYLIEEGLKGEDNEGTARRTARSPLGPPQ